MLSPKSIPFIKVQTLSMARGAFHYFDKWIQWSGFLKSWSERLIYPQLIICINIRKLARKKSKKKQESHTWDVSGRKFSDEWFVIKWDISPTLIAYLAGGFKYFLFSPLPGEMIQFD